MVYPANESRERQSPQNETDYGFDAAYRHAILSYSVLREAKMDEKEPLEPLKLIEELESKPGGIALAQRLVTAAEACAVSEGQIMECLLGKREVSGEIFADYAIALGDWKKLYATAQAHCRH